MVKRVFIDEITKNELEVFINEEGRICIIAGDIDDSGYFSGFVTITKEDAIELVDELTCLINML